MWIFQGTLKKSKQSYINSFAVCITVSLNYILSLNLFMKKWLTLRNELSLERPYASFISFFKKINVLKEKVKIKASLEFTKR